MLLHGEAIYWCRGSWTVIVQFKIWYFVTVTGNTTHVWSWGIGAAAVGNSCTRRLHMTWFISWVSVTEPLLYSALAVNCCGNDDQQKHESNSWGRTNDGYSLSCRDTNTIYTIKRNFYVCEKIVQICQNRSLNKLCFLGFHNNNIIYNLCDWCFIHIICINKTHAVII